MALVFEHISFTDAQGRTLNNYLSNVQDAHTIVFNVRAKFSLEILGGISVTVVDNTITLNGGGDWQDYGAVTGSFVSGSIGAGSLASTEILHVEENYIVLDSMSLTPGTFSTGSLEFAIDPQAFLFQLNLTPSTGVGSASSLIDGTSNYYKAEGIDTLTAGGLTNIPFTEQGTLSGATQVSAIVERLADSFGDKVYKVSISGFKNFLWTTSAPFAGDDSPKLWIRASVLPFVSDPSTSISAMHTTPVGNLGFFDEVFNGGTPAYSLQSISYQVAGVASPAVDYVQSTEFTAVVTGTFAAGSKFGIGFFHEIQIGDDQFFNAHIENNSMLCAAENLPVGSSADIVGNLNSVGAGVNIADVTISQGGTSATISGVITPNPDFTTVIGAKAETSRMYRHSVKVENSTFTDDFIQPVWITLSHTQLIRFVPPLGSFGGFGYTVRNHHNDGVPFVTGDGGLIPESLITEDDVAIELSFALPRPSEQIVLGRTFTGITLSVVAFKSTTEFFRFETADIPFSPFPVVDDAVPVNQVSQRSFRLPPTSTHNEISVERNDGIDTLTNFGLAVSYGVLLDWRYWIPEPNASSEFFVLGQDKDWFHYQTGDWRVALLCEIHTTDGDYRNFVRLNHQTYDDWEGSSEIKYFRMDGTPLTKPPTGEISRVQVRHTAPSGFAWQPGSVWGWVGAEPFQAQIRWIISSYLQHGNVVQNPLQPLVGLTLCSLSFELSDTVAVFDTLFDPDKIATENGVSFTGRVQGTVRKGAEFDAVWNTHKETVTPVKIFSPVEIEKLLKECCESRRVIADEDSLDLWKNDITSHPIPGDEVTFELRKGGTAADYAVITAELPNAAGWFGGTIAWRDVLFSNGLGCYDLYATSTAAGFEQTFLVEKYELWPASRLDADGNSVPHENTIGDCRLLVVYNFHDVKNGIDFTDSGLVDTLRVKGVFGKYQPNMQIENTIDAFYKKQKEVRRNDDTFELKTSHLSGKYVRMLTYMLLHENECIMSDYNWYNLEYYRTEAVIVMETPQLGHQDVVTRKVPVSCKFQSKLANSISSYNNRNASKVPTMITIGGNISVSGGTVYNSESTYEATFTGPTFVLPNTTVNVYEMVAGVPVLVDTFTHATLEPSTNITLDL